MAIEKPTWTYRRIRGGLKHVGHDVARNTIDGDRAPQSGNVTL